MPKPLILRRPSGLYVRFLIPADLRERLRARFIVRSLGKLGGDAARFVAAAQAVALSHAFDALRRSGDVVDIEKLLKSAQKAVENGADRPWTASNVRVGGVDFGTVETSGRADTLDFIEVMKAADELVAKSVGGSEQARPPAVPSAPATPLLSEEIASHVADLERRKLSRDTITESKHSLRILLGVVGDKPVGEIKRPEIRAFWEAVRYWPANATVRPQYRDLSVPEVVRKGKAEGVPAPSAHTLNKHSQRLGVFFNALVEADVITKSPLRGLGGEIEATEADTGRPFTDAELAQIFDPEHFVPWASKYPHRWWGPILGHYTGARVNEVAQLYIDDVREIDGVWGLFFWKNQRSQKIKTKSSIRFVPLARPVLDAGFLDFVEDMRNSGHPRLFPHLPAGTGKDGKPNGLGYGRQLSRQFSAYLKQFDIEKGTGFHAFRHTMSTRLAEARVPVGTIARITGHARKQEVPVLETHYIHIADVHTLSERVDALSSFGDPVSVPAYETFAPTAGTPKAARVSCE